MYTKSPSVLVPYFIMIIKGPSIPFQAVLANYSKSTTLSTGDITPKKAPHDTGQKALPQKTRILFQVHHHAYTTTVSITHAIKFRLFVVF